MTIGDTVFVRWYGKILEGMIVENSEVNPLLASMIIVRVPVQGVRTSALFTPDHVYPTAELAGAKEHIKVVPTVEASKVTHEVTHEVTHPSEAWKRLQEFKKANRDEEFTPAEAKNKTFEVTVSTLQDVLPADDRKHIEAFKQANWDYERNHIRIDKLEEFYQLWRMYMVPFGYVDDTKYQKEETVTVTEVKVWPAENPVSKRDTPSRAKLTKKQLNSTGEINYGDVTQLSIF